MFEAIDSDNGKILKADCGFGLDDSKSSDALLLRCSDAEKTLRASLHALLVKYSL